MSDHPFQSHHRVLLIRSAAIGDFLVCVPFILDLLYSQGLPEHQIGFLILNGFGQDPVRMVFGNDRFPTQNILVVPPSLSGVMKESRRMATLAQRFDRLCYLPFQTESRTSIIKKKLAFSATLGLNRRIEALSFVPGFMPGVSQYDSLFNTYDMLVSRKSCLPGLQIQEQEWARAQGILATMKAGPKIAVYPNSKLSMKVWPMANYASLIKQLRDSVDASVLLIGAKEDYSYNEALVRMAGIEKISNAAGHLTVRESIALLSKMDLVLGNDGAPLHMAALGGARVLGLYTHKAPPGMWSPTAASSFLTLQGQAYCGPCGKSSCADPFCLTSIPVHRVFEGALALLGGAPIRKSQVI